MTDSSHLICAYSLDGKGGGQPLEWSDVQNWTPGSGPLWAHFDCAHPNTEAWLREKKKLDTFVVDGLMAKESRPRCDWYEDGILLILRGVNQNPGAEPEDMVSIRMWITEHFVISTRIRRLMAVEDIRAQLASTKGPISPGHLVARLAASLTDRMGPTITGLSDQTQDLESQLIGVDERELPDLRSVRHQLNDVRQSAISLRRYINPQRDALARLLQVDEPWLEDRVHGRLRETMDRVTRITEELDEVRERSAIVQDELSNLHSHRMERTMYVLTVVAAVMLPLGFLTGLLGINVGGMPGSESSWAFWAVCAISLLIIIAEVYLLRRFKWI